MDFTELADLLAAFAASADTFKAEHKADYNSNACASAYQRMDDARDAVWAELLRSDAKQLATALRKAALLEAALNEVAERIVEGEHDAALLLIQQALRSN